MVFRFLAYNQKVTPGTGSYSRYFAFVCSDALKPISFITS